MAKIGYMTSSDVTNYGFGTVGDYIANDICHDDSDRFYVIVGFTANVTNSGGEALFTTIDGNGNPIAHGFTTNNRMKVRISTSYEGEYYANVLTTSTLKLKNTTGGGNISFIAAETAIIYIKFFSHDEKGFSLGEGSQGYELYQDYLISGNPADLADSYAYHNHNADGTLKNTHGDNGDNYTGPIGNRFWFHFPDKSAFVTNSGGHALFTYVDHDMPTGRYVRIKNNSVYAPRTVDDYYYVENLSANTFKLKTSATGSYLTYISDQTVTFALTIGASAMQSTDMHGTVSNPVLAVNAPGGQTTFRKNWESTTSYGFSPFGGSTYVRFTGEYNPVLGVGDINYQGHKGGYAFSQGKYGFQFQFYNKLTNNSIFNIGEGANHWEIDFVEVDGGNHGFAGIMCKRDNYPKLGTMYVIIHDCYIHDTHGEGMYLGQTNDNTEGVPSTGHAMNVQIYNCRVARTGVEILQHGQLIGPCTIENTVAFLASLTHMAPFFSGQSTGQQFSIRVGEVISRNMIIMGFTVNGFQMITQLSTEIPAPEEPVTIQNSVYHYGRGRFGYITMFDNGVTPVNFKDIYLKKIYTYDNDRNESQPAVGLNTITYYLDSVTNFTFNNLRTGVEMVTQTLTNNVTDAQLNLPHVVRDAVDPEVEFINSGYDGIPDLRDIHTWFRNYRSVHPSHPSQQIQYTTSDWVFHDGNFYKSKTNHTADLAPNLDTTNWEHIFWDSTGKRSDQVGYTTAYSNRSPDDFRLKANSFYNTKGIGLFDNDHNNAKTYIYWQYAYNNGGSPDLSFVRIAGKFRDLSHSTADLQKYLGTNKFVRRVIVARSTLGSTAVSLSSWVLI